MKLTFENPVIFVKDIERSKKFYIEVLNQKINIDFGGSLMFESGISLWEIKPDHIVSKECDTKTETVNRFELNFETNDIEGIYQNVKKHGLEFLNEIREEPWGQRTIRFFDPDYHLIEMGESLETFVMNFYNKGLTEIEVSQRTSVPLINVREIISKHI